MAISNLSTFVGHLEQSPLLQAAQRSELLRVLRKKFQDVRSLARELINRDWLTPYQVNQLLQGNGAELVMGDYILLERLGEGGMGKVYKARHRRMGRMVALKILRSNLLNNEVAVKRFTREMRAASKLDHPNIVRALDADVIGDSHYLAMEFINGTDLSRLIKRDGPMKPHQACDYIRQAAMGLQHAHEQGLVHRDIKPANLLLSHELERPSKNGSNEFKRPYLGKWGVLKILDMGLARIVPQGGFESGTELTQMGVVMGTPDFIAPEQARDSKKTDVRSDLYSLGCTLYYLLTARVPFPQGTVTEKLLHHQLDDPAPVEDVRRKQLYIRGMDPKEIKYLSNKVSDIVRILMAKKPEDRFQEPKDLVEAISDLLKPGKAISTGSNPKQTPLPVKRKKPAVAQPVGTHPIHDSSNDTPITLAVAEETPIIEKTKKKKGFWQRLFSR